MKLALYYLGFCFALFPLGLAFACGIRYGKDTDPPPVCTALCTPYTEAAGLAEDAAQRCDRALLTCLSYQGVMQDEIAEVKVAFINFKNAITGCEQQ